MTEMDKLEFPGGGGQLYPAPLHVDPTMATELAILLELAQRQQVKK